MTTVKDLRAKAKAYGMHGYSKLGKWDLERAIMEHELMLRRAAEQQEQQTQHETSRDILEAHCRAAYDCTNTEDMHSILDVIHINALAGMCRLVNATISSSPTKAECIDAFISAAMEHKAIKAAREAQASASTSATFTINPEVKPDYDAAFDEYAYSPACQFNRAIFDDERESRMFRPIKRRPATTSRRFPTPKNPRGSVSDFSLCKDPEKLRKMLNTGSIDVVKSIAESFNEFQPRIDGKTMTKSDYVTAIVRLYFPDYQPTKKAPVQETPQVNYPFVPGKIYIKAKYSTTREIELVKVIRRKGDYITVQEVSYPELVPMFKTQRVKVQHDRFLTQEGFMLNSHDTTDINHIPQDCVYSHSDYIYNPDYYQPKTSQPEHKPETPTPVQEVKQETTEQPADHEPNVKRDNEISSYAVGKQIVSLKRNAKAQQTLLKDCGDEFLLAMFGVFYAPTHVHMDTPDELRKWMCRGVLKAVRNPDYAKILLRNVKVDIKKKTHVKRAYLEGWEKFLAECVCSSEQQDKSDNIPADHEPDMQEVKPEAPAPSEPEHQQEKLCPLLSLSYWDRHTKYHNEKCRKNRKIIDTLQTIDEITAIMLDFGMSNIFEQAIYDRVHLSGQYPRETDEETTARYAETYAQKIIARRQRKAKAEISKSAPKPATRKPRHAKKTDTSRQILIPFDDEERPDPTSEPAKLKAKRRPRMPRVKTDYSRQILIDFGEDVPRSQTNQRQAA